MAVGYIYILSNESMPGLVKIGRTDRQPEDRARELGTTGVPTPFKIEYSALVQDSVEAEMQIHRVLEGRGCRRSQIREFFDLTVDEAIELVKLVTSGPADTIVSSPDFSLRYSLAEAFSVIAMPEYDEAIDEQRANLLEQRLSSIGRRGYPYALLRIAEMYEWNFVATLKVKQYWREYLELARLEMSYLATQPASNGLDNRRALGKAAAQYLDRLAGRGWVSKSDFDFVQAFLISGDQFTYEGYIDAVQRHEFPSSIREQALNL